ncbi:glycoside hydrolase family 2 TIM barrel-domain containing protein [Bacteroides ovatus]|uniref:glycoside hydrolase family 2 TIM barrel-domain containing protein n=1 Tax=Bacteroides ovatus TaxID=28116 RepID=UPI0022E73147|nr:glycoside hydrolase family 2 TIM barrel-domain containing protein [Bacteroides ovatus]
MNKKCQIWMAAVLAAITLPASAQRTETKLTDGWEFRRDGLESDKTWKAVTIPHDWAIYGPFSRENDLQHVTVEQNGETEDTWKTGRTGGLPFIGKGAYKRIIEIRDTTDCSYTLVFDGAMSNANVSINGKHAIAWPYGYNSFYTVIDSLIRPGKNELIVELENKVKQSRWYPGAGLYRNVHLVKTDKIHIPTWGTYITTPTITPEYASVKLQTEINGAGKGKWVDVITEIKSPDGAVVATSKTTYVSHGQPLTQNFIVNNPILWSPEKPDLYTASIRLIVEGKNVDTYDTRFGIRKIEYIPEKGFFLNGKVTKFKGVCNHHDLGPLGAAVNEAALRHQVELLKDMGANAIRTAHNMPAPELVKICDEMGMLLMIEPFDDWGFRPKSENGYGKIFNDWAERDITNMIKQYRSNPSVVMWSIGNEVPSQWGPDGISELMMLQDLIHQLDPTRPVTCGMDQIGAVLENGFAAALDIPGFNYKPQHYDKAYEKLPQKMILGAETASTFSSRGIYYWPVIYRGQVLVYHPENQSNSYDNENASWSNVPDLDFIMDDDKEWMIGQFVWTGFDYLGEPTPYDTDAWPSHSSVFGIFDLASLPKDRFYLYRSLWNKEDHTLHVLPHWNLEGREGKKVPVYVYTDYPEAELFINGVSQGRQRKLTRTEYESSTDSLALQKRYRLMWNDVIYQPGEVKVTAYDENGNPADEKIIKTAGKPHHLVLSSNRTSMKADGEDLVYITVQVADKNGNLVPTDTRKVNFKVSGAGKFRAAANGDPTCTELFHEPDMTLFSGALTAIIQSSEESGKIVFEAYAKGVKPAKIILNVE